MYPGTPFFPGEQGSFGRVGISHLEDYTTSLTIGKFV
jgi:hypothetical protein